MDGRKANRSTAFKGQYLSVWLDLDGTEYLINLSLDDGRDMDPKPDEIWSANWSAARTLIVREQ